MSLFSMNWFKSKRDVALDAEIKRLEKKLEYLNMDCFPTPGTSATLETSGIGGATGTSCTTGTSGTSGVDRSYKKVKLVNDVLTIILNDGSVISRSGSLYDDFLAVRNAKTEEEVLSVVSSPEGRRQLEKIIENIAEVEKIHSKIDVLIESGEFEFRDDALYMRGVDRSIPEILIEQFSAIFNGYQYGDILETTLYQALKKFWLKCCLNPNAQSAEDLYTFLSKHQFRIDRHGNFYAYRRVVSVRGETDQVFVDFVSNAYNKVKAVWKKNPADFEVLHHEYEGYSFNKSSNVNAQSGRTVVGNLKELYINLPNMASNSYTDAHTRSFDYRIGKSVSMPRHMGDDDNTVSCSKGFHSASKEYDYSGFGDTPILMIINPIDVLAVPMGEVGKLRICRWFFAMTLPEDEKYILDDEEFDVTDLGDIFEEECLQGLTDYVQNSFAEEVQRHTFNIPKLSASTVGYIVSSLDEMQKVISDRISLIK